MNSDKKINLNLNLFDDLSQSCDRPCLWSIASTFLSNYEAACHLFLHGASKQGNKSWVGVGLTAHREPGRPWRSGGKRPKVPVKKGPFNQTLFHSSEECVCTGNGSRLFYKRTFLLLFSPSRSPARALISRSCHISSYSSPFFPFLCLIASPHPCFLFSSCLLVQAPQGFRDTQRHTAWIKADLSGWCVHTKDTHTELVFLWDIRSPSADSVSRSCSEWPVLAWFSTLSVSGNQQGSGVNYIGM